MGLFTRSRKDEPEERDGMSHAEAFVGVAMCATYADGVLDAQEWEDLGHHLMRMRAFDGMDERAVRDAFVNAERVVRQEGEEALLQRAAAALPARLRATAYFLAADLVCSDGQVGPDEHRVLDRVQAHLDVDDATAQKVLDVIAIKNAG